MLKQRAPFEDFFLRCSCRSANRQGLRLADCVDFLLGLVPLGSQVGERLGIEKGRCCFVLVLRRAFCRVAVRCQSFGGDGAPEDHHRTEDHGPKTNSHEQVRATFKGTSGDSTLKIAEQGKEREVPFRPPLAKLDHLKPGQDVVLLMDDKGYVLEIATPEVTPDR